MRCGVVRLFCSSGDGSPSSTRCVGDAELARIRAGQRHQQNDAAGEGDHVRLRAADSSAALQAAVEKTDSVELSSIELAAAAPESCHSAATSSSKPTTTPPPRRWRRFFGNRALAAIYVAHWTHNWSWYLLLSWLPKLLTQRGADVTGAGFLSTLPPLIAFLLANGGAAVADRVLLARMQLSVTAMRRIMGAFAHLGPSVALALLALLADPGPAVSAVLACGAIGFGALTMSAFWPNIMDVAPKHPGIVVGISNTMATLPGILCNLSTGFLLGSGYGWTPAHIRSAP